MDTFQTIVVMLAFGSFILALLTYIEKKRKITCPGCRQGAG